MTRPEDLIYAVDERPPLLRLIFLGLQHALLMSVYLVLIVIVFRHAGASHAATVSALSLGMLALAASTVLQAIWRGPVGSGYLARPVFSAIYIGPAVLAASTSGLPAVFAMTVFSGFVEVGLAPLLRRLRGLFPPAISGFIVAIVGIQLGVIGVGDLLGVDEQGRAELHDEIAVAFLTLGTTVALSVWGSRRRAPDLLDARHRAGSGGEPRVGIGTSSVVGRAPERTVRRDAAALLPCIRISSRLDPSFPDGGLRGDAAHSRRHHDLPKDQRCRLATARS
jgi:hypothetical protein